MKSSSTEKNTIQQLKNKLEVLTKTVSDLKKSEQLLNTAVDSAPIGMVTLTIKGKFETVNKAFCQIIGYTKKELLNFNISQITHPDDKRIGEKVIEELTSGKSKKANFEKRYIHKKGYTINAQVSTVIIRDKFGSPQNFFTQVIDMTTQQKYKENLIKSEQKYKAVVESARDMIIVIQDDIIKFANQHAVEIYGKPLNKIIGQPLVKFVHPDSLEAVKKRYIKWKSGKKIPNVFKLDLIDSNNEKRICEVRSSTTTYDGQSAELVLINDITKRKQAEQALRISENKYKNLVEKAGIAILIDDRKGNLTFFNKRFADMYGYSEQEIKKKSTQTLVHPEDINKVMNFHNNRLAGKKVPSRYEFRGVKKDGSVIHLETDVTILKEGNLAIGTRSYLWDITKRKRVESQFRQNEKMLQQIFDTSPNLIFLKDRNGMYLMVNKKMAELHKTKPADLVGKYDYEIARKWFETIDYNEFRKTEQDIIDKKKKLIIIEEPFVFQDGIERWFQTTKIPFELGYNKNCLLVISIDITERKHSEKKLQKSEKRLALAVEGAGLGLWDQDFASGKIIRNERWAQMLGYNLNEIEQNRIAWRDLIHPDDEAVLEKIAKEHEQGKTRIFSVEHRMRTKNGKWKWIHNWGRVVERDKNGKPLRAIGVHLDITDRKRAEEKLKESEERFRIIFDNEPECVKVLNPDMTLVSMNPAGLAILEVKSLDELKGQSILPMIHKEFRNDFRKLTDNVCKKGISGTMSFWITGFKGTQRFLETHAVPIQDSIAGVKLLGVTRDITERKRIEEKLINSEQLYKEAQALAKIGHWNYNLKQDNLFWSNELFSIFEIDKNFGQLSIENFLNRIHPDDRDNIREQIKRNDNYRSDYRIVIDDGSIKYMHEDVEIVRQKDGKIVMMKGTAQDITERKMAEKEIENKSKELERQFKNSEEQRIATLSVLSDLNETTKELQFEIAERKKSEEELKKYRNHLEKLVKVRTAKLEEANKELEAFSYSVSHDLRVPLRAINGFTRILVEDHSSKLDKEGKQLGSVIQHNAKKMGKLIDDLLTFSRMGRALMNPSKIDMKNMVNSMFYEVTSEDDRRRIKLTVADLSEIEGDTIMIRQVWINLISNAIKFSSNRKQAVIAVTSKEEKDKVTYCIKDNGVGFNMKYIDKLFGVFQRLHSEKEFEGTGVGLALVRRIVNRHGGSIWAESNVGKSAKFYFSLPKKGTKVVIDIPIVS